MEQSHPKTQHVKATHHYRVAEDIYLEDFITIDIEGVESDHEEKAARIARYYREISDTEGIYAYYVRPLPWGQQDPIDARAEDVFLAGWENALYSCGQYLLIPLGPEHD